MTGGSFIRRSRARRGIGLPAPVSGPRGPLGVRKEIVPSAPTTSEADLLSLFIWLSGERGGTRTHDALIKSHMF
jgi:hypothetical protein